MTQLVLMFCAHFICDTVLQPPHVSAGKNPWGLPAAIPRHVHLQNVWQYFLAGHAGTHAVAVYLITGSPAAFAAEFVSHAAIDLAKCRGWFGPRYHMHIDQGLHLLCKVAWWGLL